MANGSILDTLRQGALAFASGTPRSQIQRAESTRSLLGGIEEAAAQPGFNAATNPLVAQLAAVNPQVGGQVSTQFENLSNQRRQAMFDDAFAVRELLDRSPERAAEFLQDRIGAGSIANSAMADTRNVLAQIESGDIEGAKSELDALIDVGIATGAIKQPTSAMVQSSQILPDGTTVQVLKSGTTRVVGADGNELSGEDRGKAIRNAAQFGAETQGQRSRERTLGSEIAKTSIEVGKDAFDKLPAIRKNIANLNRVTKLLDEGAKTGAVQRFLPSVQAASVSLDNLRNELGLDVVGGTTFGALSESELEFALDTALPDRLDEPALKKWAIDKGQAQEKVAEELRKVAKFFSLGGTITDFIELEEKRGQRADTAPINPPQAAPQSGAIGRFQVEVVQ